MARSDPSSYVIEILEGPNAGLSIELSGREMPYRSGSGGSVEYRRKQRIQQTFYPGNPVATHLVFGRVLMPTQINGIWKDRYLGEDAAIDLVEVFEKLVDQGALVRVSWSTIVRVGHAEEFGWKPGDPTGGLTDIAWDLTFMWMRDDTTRTNARPAIHPPMRDQIGTFAANASLFREEVKSLTTTTKFFVGSISLLYQPKLTEIENLLVEAEQAEVALASVAARLLDDERMPAFEGEEALSSAEKVVEVAHLVAEVVDGTSPARSTVSDEAALQLAEAIDRHELIERAVNLLIEGFALRVRLEEVLRPLSFVEVRPARGSDLRELGIEFFGDADTWREIARANGLEDSKIPDDVDVIYVPEELTSALDPGEVGA